MWDERKPSSKPFQFTKLDRAACLPTQQKHADNGGDASDIDDLYDGPPGRNPHSMRVLNGHGRKKPYATLEEATNAVRPELIDQGVRPYPCDYCPAWHIGHWRTLTAQLEHDCLA